MQPNIALESLMGARQPAMFLQSGALALPTEQSPAAGPVADRALRETFVWTLAHELRQPLSVLSTAVAMVQQDTASEATARAADVMVRQIAQMSRMIEDLVDAARLTTGKVSLQPERLDLRVVLADAAIDVAAPMAERKHTFEVNGGTVPLWVRADPQRMLQVFSNLLHNAIKYTEPGGRITLDGESGPLTVTARVRDTGHGIGAPGLARIFDLFTQIHPSATGLGIGLNVVREIIALHSGMIEARSEGLGKGSEFVVVLPRVD